MTDIFRKCSRAFLINGDLPNALSFSSDAVKFAAELESNHQKLADALTDYGIFLHNTGNLQRAREMYKDILVIRTEAFGAGNLCVAMAHHVIAKCFYQSILKGASGGRVLSDAHKHANRAIKIMSGVLPSDHILLKEATALKAAIKKEDHIASYRLTKNDGLTSGVRN